MFSILNILIVILVLLIAYWWANQGLFSAILHLVAVIAAGAIAFAVWEPLTYMQLSGSKWDGYAWGVTLIGAFAVMLFIIRFSLDKIAPANVELPHWANLVFGFPVGGAAGVLTMGIVVIGGGHLQSQTIIMGLGGWARSQRSGQIEKLNNLWLPVHTVTANFYSYISASSFWVPNPMMHVNPQIDRQAVSLIRDSFANGTGAIAMSPGAVTIRQAGLESTGELSVELSFASSAIDYNDQLTLSSSQVRLIGRPSSPLDEPEVVHPHAWTQRGDRFEFESHGWYATSVPARESAELVFHFRIGDMTPQYIQIRGTRFDLPQIQQDGLRDITVATGPEIDPTAPDISSAVEVTNDIRPIVIGTNNMPSGIDHQDRYFTTTGGRRIEFPDRGQGRPPRSLRIEGFYAPTGTRIVQVRVDHGSPANIFRQSLLDDIPDNAQIALVDTNGNSYSPIGYLHVPEESAPVILLDPDRYVRTLDDLTLLPEGSRDEMKLIFRVTIGAEIAGLAFGDVTVGRCNVPVEQQQ